jgi:hypothetical protein
MRKICSVISSIIVVLGLIVPLQRSSAYQDDLDPARDALFQAQNSMIRAFNETQKLSRTGANVSIQKENLTIVQSLIDKSQIAYDQGDFSASLEFSHQAVDLANEIIAENLNFAIRENERLNIARYTTIASFVLFDLFVAVVGLYTIDRIYKHQKARLLKKRPKTGG